MTETAATNGPRLKAERERRGLSTQKAADELHLDNWVVDALEAEDYERIGPAVYAKGHLKRYAALLGLPPGEIMAGYESRVQAPQTEPTRASNVRLRTDEADAGLLPLARIVGSAAVAVLALVVLWWKPWHHRVVPPAAREPPATSPTATTADNAADLAASQPADAGGASAPAAMANAVTPSSSTPSSTTPSSTPGTAATAGLGRARLRLSFSADSWIDVHDASGKRAFAGHGRANSVRTIAGSAPMRVYLGFASGVQLEINDRAVAIGPQFVAGDVARFEAGADGILRRDTHAATTGAASPSAAAPGAQSRNARPSG